MNISDRLKLVQNKRGSIISVVSTGQNRKNSIEERLRKIREERNRLTEKPVEQPQPIQEEQKPGLLSRARTSISQFVQKYPTPFSYIKDKFTNQPSQGMVFKIGEGLSEEKTIPTNYSPYKTSLSSPKEIAKQTVDNFILRQRMEEAERNAGGKLLADIARTPITIPASVLLTITEGIGGTRELKPDNKIEKVLLGEGVSSYTKQGEDMATLIDTYSKSKGKEIDKKYLPIIAGALSSSVVGLDFLDLITGGGKSKLIKEMIEATTEKHAKELAQKMGIDATQEVIEQIIKTTDKKVADNFITEVAKIKTIQKEAQNEIQQKVIGKETPEVKTDTKPVKSEIKEDSLIQEARKYKSAEEFMKAQGTPVYHGTSEDFSQIMSKRQLRESGAKIEASNIGGDSPFVHLTDNDQNLAKGYAKARMVNMGGTPKVLEYRVQGKILDLTKHPSEYTSAEKKLLTEIGNELVEKSGSRGADATIGGAFKMAGKERKSYMDINKMNIGFGDIERSNEFSKILES